MAAGFVFAILPSLGPGTTVQVHHGQSFAPRTVFAGYNDFPAYLASISTEMPMLSPHEW
jgi:hypothetical protein